MSQTFLGKTNFIRAYIKDGMAETPFGRVRVGGTASGNALLSIRPECLQMMASDVQRSTTKSGRIVGQAFKRARFYVSGLK